MTIGRRVAGAPAGQTTIAVEEVRQQIIAIVEEMVADWELEGDPEITVDTSLVADLGCGSVDIIYLVVAIEETLQRPKLGFQELLMTDGRYVDDIKVGQLVDFVVQKLSQANS